MSTFLHHGHENTNSIIITVVENILSYVTFIVEWRYYIYI